MYIQLLSILGLVVIDRVLKVYMTNLLSDVYRVDFIPGVIHFVYLENTGASFGILQNATVLLSVVTFLVLLLLLYYIVSKRSSSRLLTISLVLITAGGIGNLYDRIVYGYVVDYIEFSFINYAVFNFADTLVNIGAVMLFVYLIFFDRQIIRNRDKTTVDDGDTDGDE
ncbi:MAG: signal peptidase II [Oscillospiraceae bacterium]|nr:signal peptidase II [Oscillospiraceae bacterium]